MDFLISLVHHATLGLNEMLFEDPIEIFAVSKIRELNFLSSLFMEDLEGCIVYYMFNKGVLVSIS